MELIIPICKVCLRIRQDKAIIVTMMMVRVVVEVGPCGGCIPRFLSHSLEDKQGLPL